jgi:hypothetical protein
MCVLCRLPIVVGIERSEYFDSHNFVFQAVSLETMHLTQAPKKMVLTHARGRKKQQNHVKKQQRNRVKHNKSREKTTKPREKNTRIFFHVEII